MLPHEARIRVGRLRRRCNLTIFVSSLLAATSVYLVVAGLIVLVTKIFWYQASPYLYVLLPGWLPAAAAAAVLYARRQYHDADVVGIADRSCEAGGLLLTLTERDNSLWEAELGRALHACSRKLPRLRWRMFLRPLPCALFLVLAFVVPQAIPALRRTVSPLQYEELKKLEEEVELISQESLLTEQEAKELQEEIERMMDSPAESQESRWEAIDSLREKVTNEMADVHETLTRAENAAAWGSREQVEKALMSLAQKGLLTELPPELARALGPGGQVSAKTPPSLKDPAALEAARRYLSRLARAKCPKLAKAGFAKTGSSCPSDVNLDEFEMTELAGTSFCKGAGDGTGDGMCLGDGFSDEPGPDGDGKPGRGGINRGRGDAPMVWGDESDEQKVKFAPKELPPITIGPDQEMPVVGIGILEPRDTELLEATSSGRVIDFGRVTGSDMWQRKISPRHRGLVRKYFSGEKTQ